MTDAKTTGALLITTGAAILAIVPVLSKRLQPYGWPMNIAGIALVIIGILIALAGYLPQRRSPFGNYRTRRIGPGELEPLQRITEQFTHGETSTLEEKKTLLAVNPDLFHVVEKFDKSNKRPVIVGYFTLYPLKTNAVEEIKAGIRTQWYRNRVDSQDLAQRKAAGIYIGFLWGNRRQDRAATIDFLKREIRISCEKLGTSKVFARPMTTEGLHIMKRYGFQQVVGGVAPELSRVCLRDLIDNSNY